MAAFNNDEASSERWKPPSSSLDFHEGVWQNEASTRVSYPVEGNNECFLVEDRSFWFRHRMACLQALMVRFPPGGMFWDIGGGNGFTAACLQTNGTDAALLEPGDGVFNARRRGVRRIVRATLEGAGFAPHVLPAAGAFDVLEHIDDDIAFVRTLHNALVPGGRFFCTVPAGPHLWSHEDEHAGHFRRYQLATLTRTLRAAGFELEYATYFFSWLVVPVLLSRMLPYRLGFADSTRRGMEADHHLPPMLTQVVGQIHRHEQRLIEAGKTMRWGTSLLCVARSR